MASIQYERQAGELSNEEKVTLDELIKQAESEDVEAQALAVVAKNEGLDKDAADPKLPIQISSVVGVLQNQTAGPLSLLKYHIWGGYLVKPFPNPLHRTGTFLISGLQNKGVKAAVEYSGKNKIGVECGWLIAFAYSKAHGFTILEEELLLAEIKEMEGAKEEVPQKMIMMPKQSSDVYHYCIPSGQICSGGGPPEQCCSGACVPHPVLRIFVCA